MLVFLSHLNSCSLNPLTWNSFSFHIASILQVENDLNLETNDEMIHRKLQMINTVAAGIESNSKRINGINWR